MIVGDLPALLHLVGADAVIVPGEYPQDLGFQGGEPLGAGLDVAVEDHHALHAGPLQGRGECDLPSHVESHQGNRSAARVVQIPEVLDRLLDDRHRPSPIELPHQVIGQARVASDRPAIEIGSDGQVSQVGETVRHASRMTVEPPEMVHQDDTRSRRRLAGVGRSRQVRPDGLVADRIRHGLAGRLDAGEAEGCQKEGRGGESVHRGAVILARGRRAIVRAGTTTV